MAFVRGIRVFDRAGIPIGVIPKWSVSAPRSYRLNEVEEFGFTVPRNDGPTVILTAGVVALLERDNLIFIQNDVAGMPGWAGAIVEVVYGGGNAEVKVAGMLSLLSGLETTLIEQDEGNASTTATRLIQAAQAKQAGHGDLVMGMVVDATQPQWGQFSYDGDVLQGLQRLATDTLSEFYVRSWIASGGTLRCELHWGAQYETDLTSIVITDGPGGQIAPGANVRFNGEQRANYGRLVGAETRMTEYLDYPVVANVMQELTPEAVVALPQAVTPTARRREAVDFSVSWSYSLATQRALAQQVQDLYLDYYKRFLYAFHQRFGMPFLEGYDWSFPGGQKGKKLTTRSMRTKAALGFLGSKSIVFDVDPEGDVDARIEDWRQKYQVAMAGLAGMASAHDAMFDVLILGSDGVLSRCDHRTLDDVDTSVSLRRVLSVPSGETPMGVATDPSDPQSVWIGTTNGVNAIIRKHDLDSGQVLASWAVAQPTMCDFAIDAPRGRLYSVNTGGSVITVRDLASGTVIADAVHHTDGVTIDGQIAHGLSAPVGVAFSGGILYVIATSGRMRVFWEDDGGLAGEFDTGEGHAVTAFYLSPERGEAWISRTDVTDVYNAAIAVATVDAPGPVDGAPGFGKIAAGQFVRIVMADNRKIGDYDDEPGVPTEHGLYMPTYRSQHGWATIFDSCNCMFASASMAFDRHTRGAGKPTPPQLRSASGSRARTGTFEDIAKAWRVWSAAQGMAVQHLDVNYRMPFREIVRMIRQEKRGAVLAGDNDQLPEPSGGFLGDHAVFVQRILDDGRWEVWDPNYHSRKAGVRLIEPGAILRYLKKFAYGKPVSKGGYGSRWRHAPDRGSVCFTRPTPRRQDQQQSLGRAEKVYVVYSPGRWQDQTVPGDLPGSPSRIEKVWQVGEQKEGFKPADDVKVADPEQVIQGEEGRVADWDPTTMGYGVKGTSWYRTRSRTVVRSSNRWYLRPWDAGTATFWLNPPAWPEGEAHLQLLLTKHNREQGAQAFDVLNIGGLWTQLRLGGIYTFHKTLDGVSPGGITGPIRVVAFSPDEARGTCQILAEWMG